MSFEDCKVGDLVVVHNAGFYREDEICKVTKVTSKLFYVGSLRFYKMNGLGYGNSSWCNIPTLEKINEIKYRKMREFVVNACKDFSVVKELTSEELKTIYEILKRHKNEQDK